MMQSSSPVINMQLSEGQLDEIIEMPGGLICDTYLRRTRAPAVMEAHLNRAAI